MEFVEDAKDFSSLKDNVIKTSKCNVNMINSIITFTGKGNVVFFIGKTITSRVALHNSRIECIGDNNLIFISNSKHLVSVKIRVGHGCNIFIGKNFSAVSPVSIFANEKTNVHVGFGCLFAREVFIRTSDMHMMYDINTKERLNPNKDVFIGDHVWVGQNVHILKGAVIGNGSVVGDHALCTTNKTDKVNSVYIGAPAKFLKDNIVWTTRGTNKSTEEDVESGRFNTYDDVSDGFKDFYVYEQEGMPEVIKEFSKINECKTIEDRLEFLKKYRIKKAKILKAQHAQDLK